MTSNFETRVAQIAWLVLAGSACRPADTASPSATTVDLATPKSTTTADVATTDAGMASAPDAAIFAASPPDPKAVCGQYQAAATSDPKGPRAQTPTQTQRVYMQASPEDLRARRIDESTIECSIVWERTQSMETVMVTPTCCPQSRMTTPCPPASPQRFPGERTKLEIAVVRNDASRVSSSLVFNQWVQEPPRHMCGRRPEGFEASTSTSTTPIGACLAEMAELEAASIAAFDRLARELVAHGAPMALVARAKAARRDEARHARTMQSLARRFGAKPRARGPGCGNRAVRDRLAIAIENAVEGCVFETFGAVVATFQAARAEDPEVRAAFASVAEDERRHAALAWDVDAWLSTLCTSDERNAIENARREAREQLGASSTNDDEPTRRMLGLPLPWERAALARGVQSLARS